jgi:hypothetical protein
MNIRDLVPKHKSDIEPIDKLKQHFYEDIKSIIPELLVCLQDGHWNIAEPIAMYLQHSACYITKEIIQVLQTDDEEWKKQILRWFGFDTNDLILKRAIEEIALNPTKYEVEDGTLERALEIIEYWKSK